MKCWKQLMAALAIFPATSASALAPPVLLTPDLTSNLPTAAARAVSVAQFDVPLLSPVNVTLQCIVEENGSLRGCGNLEGAGTTDPTELWRRSWASIEKAKVDPILAVALSRMPHYRTRLARPVSTDIPTVIVREVVSPFDWPPSSAAVAKVAQGELRIVQATSVKISDFYPSDARRGEVEARASATCRVLADLSLFCREPQVQLTAQLIANERSEPSPENARYLLSFARATMQVLAAFRVQPRTVSGEDSIGLEGPFNVVWRIPPH